MYKNILIPITLDHEHDPADAIRNAQAWCAEGGQLTALHVIEEVPTHVMTYLPEGHARKIHEEISERLNAALSTFDDVTPAIITGHAGRSIIDFAEEHGCDLIVIASHRPELSDFFLGSTAARVVRHAQCGVLVMR